MRKCKAVTTVWVWHMISGFDIRFLRHMILCVLVFCSLRTLRAIASRLALLAVWLAIVRPIAACQFPKVWLHYPQVVGHHQRGTRQNAASFAEHLARRALRCRADCRQRGTLLSHGKQGSGTSQKAWFVGCVLQSGTELHNEKTFFLSGMNWWQTQHWLIVK